MKKLLSLVLVLSVVAPAFAMDQWDADIATEGIKLRKVLEEVLPEMVKTFFNKVPKVIAPQPTSWKDTVFGFGTSLAQGTKAFGGSVAQGVTSFGQSGMSLGRVGLSRCTGIFAGAADAVKAFDKDVFIESCKQDPAKPIVIIGGSLFAGIVTYKLGKGLYQAASKRIQTNRFANALAARAETDEAFTLEWVTEVAPEFLKQDGELSVAIVGFMNDRTQDFKAKGLITLVTEYRKDCEDKTAVEDKIARIKLHILSSSY